MGTIFQLEKKNTAKTWHFVECVWPTFFGSPLKLGGGDKKGAIFLVYVVAHLVFFEVAQLTGENV